MKSIRLSLRKGFAIPFVILVAFAVISGTGIMFTMFYNNHNHAVIQEKNLQAYYCAMTGIEMGTAALLTDTISPPASTSLLEHYKNIPLASARNLNLTDNVTFPPGPDGTSMGSVEITLSAPVKPGTSPSELWIRVEAIGTQVDAAGKTFSVGVVVWYSSSNPAIFEQEHVVL